MFLMVNAAERAGNLTGIPTPPWPKKKKRKKGKKKNHARISGIDVFLHRCLHCYPSFCGNQGGASRALSSIVLSQNKTIQIRIGGYIVTEEPGDGCVIAYIRSRYVRFTDSQLSDGCEGHTTLLATLNNPIEP
jgi:hypothetical protein